MQVNKILRFLAYFISKVTCISYGREGAWRKNLQNIKNNKQLLCTVVVYCHSYLLAQTIHII